MIRYYPTLVDLNSNSFVLCTNVKVYLYNNKLFIVGGAEHELNIHEGKD